MTNVRIIHPAEGLPLDIGASIFALTNSIWPSKSGAAEPATALARWKARESIHCVILDDQKEIATVLAHALIFKRQIFTVQSPLDIGALASVCVHPDYRGRGWGADVTRAAFALMPELGVEVSLFQTGVPVFYEKLGGRLVHNRFYNGQTPDNPGNPFWNVETMIYPATFPWPDGDIDLNGPGY